MLLKDRVAIVTGGSSGIGRGICLEFAREGARVVVADIQEKPKRGKHHEQDAHTPTVAEIEKNGGEGLFVEVDMSEERLVRELVEQSVAHFGWLDILVNNAGIYIRTDSQRMSMSEWERIVNINLKGVFMAIRFALPHLRRSPTGRIINIASVHAFRGGAGPAYAAAKAGVVNLTRDTAVEAAADRVTVNAICPGYIETAIQDYMTAEQVEEVKERTPLQCFGTPRDIGRACVFFSSDDASWITGTALPVDGGWLASIAP